jgi:hypothetical protein
MEFFVRNGEFMTTFCPARSQNAATIGTRHSLAKTVLIPSFSL